MALEACFADRSEPVFTAERIVFEGNQVIFDGVPRIGFRSSDGCWVWGIGYHSSSLLLIRASSRNQAVAYRSGPKGQLSQGYEWFEARLTPHRRVVAIARNREWPVDDLPARSRLDISAINIIGG
jgi:hypothetical protein